MRTLHDIPAPAKLNLFLHVTGRRADGYHLIQSVFMLIDWCDRLHFEHRSDGQITREDLAGEQNGANLPADDLCVRAARALQSATGCTQGVHIGLEKHIPSQAGMGGGSSDAASTLLALNQLWALGLTREQLCRIGLSLGADVPFFIGGQNAWVEGIGEEMTPVRLPAGTFVVAKPRPGLDTGKIFSDESLKRDTKPAILEGFAAHPWSFGNNDLQPVAERLCPLIAEGIALFRDHGLQGRMTGSGSALFAPLSDNMPTGLLQQFEQADWQARVCNNMDIHPLAGWVTILD